MRPDHSHFDSPAVATAVERWFGSAQRELPWRLTYDPYAILVSELMLQQTRMEVVVPYFNRFVQALPTVQALAEAEESEVLSLWSGLGYYRRARALREAARQIVAVHGGEVPAALSALQSLPGVGRYTAGAVRSIGFDLPAPVVEGNVTRVLSRYLGIVEPVGSAASLRKLWDSASALSGSAKSPRMLSQGLMELGAVVCTPQNPSCRDCPLSDGCAALRLGMVEELPRMPAPAAQVRLEIPLYVVIKGEVLLVVRMASGSLMREMVHLPHGSDALLPMGLGGKFIAGRELGTVRHSVTHRRIEFRVTEGREVGGSIGESPHQFLWLTPAEILAGPHPSYVAKALKLLGRSGPTTTSNPPPMHS